MRTSGLSVLLILVLCLGGCTAAQQKTYEQARITFMQYLDEGQERTDAALQVAGDALAKLDEALKRADSDVPVELPKGDVVVDVVKAGADVVGPFVPFPFNYIVLLTPFVVGWLRANSQRKKREQEEVLLVTSLRGLRKEDPAAFKKFLRYRDMAAQGLLTGKQFARLLEGIEQVRQKYTLEEDYGSEG